MESERDAPARAVFIEAVPRGHLALFYGNSGRKRPDVDGAIPVVPGPVESAVWLQSDQ